MKETNIPNYNGPKVHFIDTGVSHVDVFLCRFGAEMPFYINVVREPLERLVSDYYFLRFHLAGMFPMDKERRARVNSIPTPVACVGFLYVRFYV